MKKFRIGFFYEESGHTVINAKNKAEAEKKVMKHLTDKGLEGLSWSVVNREYNVVSVEEIK